MASVVVDDHLLRDVLTGERTSDLGGIAPDGIATTGLWLFRLCASFADPEVAGKLSGPVAELPPDIQDRFRALVISLPAEIEVLAMRELSWTMAVLQQRHRSEGRGMSAAMVEALAAAHQLNAGIVVSTRDVGPNLRDSAIADGIAFHTLQLDLAPNVIWRTRHGQSSADRPGERPGPGGLGQAEPTA